jgi:hypothetical protein
MLKTDGRLIDPSKLQKIENVSIMASLRKLLFIELLLRLQPSPSVIHRPSTISHHKLDCH